MCKEGEEAIEMPGGLSWSRSSAAEAGSRGTLELLFLNNRNVRKGERGMGEAGRGGDVLL